jgi:hypothetical protein
MSFSNRWVYVIFGLLIFLIGCVEDNPNIRPASEATIGGTGGAGQLTISWNTVMAESYDLYMGTLPGGAEAGRKLANVANPFRMTDLPVGATYYFVLSAKNDDRTTLQSEEIAHQIQGPDDRLTVSFPAKTTGITLAWDPSEEASSYHIYWRNAPGVTRQNGIKIPNVDTPHKLTGLIPGVTYYFVVTAVGKNGGESNVSEEISHESPR